MWARKYLQALYPDLKRRHKKEDEKQIVQLLPYSENEPIQSRIFTRETEVSKEETVHNISVHTNTPKTYSQENTHLNFIMLYNSLDHPQFEFIGRLKPSNYQKLFSMKRVIHKNSPGKIYRYNDLL